MTIAEAVDGALAFGAFQHRTELLDFARAAEELEPRSIAIEIGAHRGGTAWLLCALGFKTVISIDLPDGPWGGIGVEAADARDAALSAKWGSAYVPVRGDSRSEETFRQVAESRFGRVDLLLIDGDHSYLGVKHDYHSYRGLVRPGGIIAFHDVNDTRFHRDRGVMVAWLWNELKGHKLTFSANEPWGGIGVLYA